MPSRGSGLAVAVARTTLSPIRTTTEPCACLANLPVSKEMVLPAASSTDTSCFMIHFLLAGGHARCVWRNCTVEGQEPVAFWDGRKHTVRGFFLISGCPSAGRPDDSDGGPANTPRAGNGPAETYLRRPSLCTTVL